MLTAKRLRKVLSYRPYNWNISVEGERWQSRSCWRYSRRKKMGGVIIKFALVVDLIRQVALLGSI
jgi:hypothetical protein